MRRARRKGADAGFRSVVLDEPCRHRHALYREARDCGYKRTAGGKAGTWESHVVNAGGGVVDSARGAELDVARENEARAARAGERDAEVRRLRGDQRKIDESQWWNPLRPRGRGE